MTPRLGSARRAALVAMALTPAPLCAQAPVVDPVATAQIRSGPLGINPGVVVSAGVDSNQNREAIDSGSGFEVFIIPQVEAWLRLGPLRLGGAVAAEFIRIEDTGEPATLTGQPTANLLRELRLERPGHKLQASAHASLKETNARPTGYEIGARSRREEREFGGRLDIRLGARTHLRSEGGLQQTRWDAAAVYQGSPLREFLTSDITSFTSSVAYRATALTEVSASVEWREDDFEFSPLRNQRSQRYLFGVSFDQRALISGAAFVGYRRSTALGEARDDGPGPLQGPVAAVQLSHASPLGFFIQGGVIRDRVFSFDPASGTYALTTGSGLVSTRLAGRFDVFTEGILSRAQYDNGRLERHVEYGGGISYRPRPLVRVGLRFTQYRHTALRGVGQTYDGYVVGTFLTYGTRLARPLDRPLPP
jgi:hypothetical protein